MDRDRVNFDALGSKRSNSKQLSEALSLDKEEENNSQLLEKSLVLEKPQKSHFFLSVELENSKEFQTNPPLLNSPPRAGARNFLQKFSKRFDSLRRSAIEEEHLNNSVSLSIFKGEQPLPPLEKPEPALVSEKKSTSSHLNPQSRHSGNASWENAPRTSSDSGREPPRREEVSQASKKIKKPSRRRSLRQSAGPEEGAPPRPVFKHLQRLYDLFFGLFLHGQVCAEDYDLKPWEEEILSCLIQRKYFYKLTPAELVLSPAEKTRRINEVLNSRSNKRPEECYKFLLTRINKFLKRKFLQEKDLDSDAERAFYEYYFGEVAESLNVSIENFYYPITRKQVDKIKLNANYFERIFKSQKFLKDIQHYIDHRLKLEYQDELKQKLRSLLGRYDAMFHKSPGQWEEVVRRVKEYLLKNKRCKLPWTVKEINESVQRFSILLEHYKTSDHLSESDAP